MPSSCASAKPSGGARLGLRDRVGRRAARAEQALVDRERLARFQPHARLPGAVPAAPGHGGGARVGHCVHLDGRRFRDRRRACAGRREAFAQRVEHELVRSLRVTEAHLALGRMHVDVHPCRVDLEEQDEGGMAVVMQHVLVGLTDGVGQQAVAHEAAVDVHVLRVARGSACRGRGDEPVHACGLAAVVQCEHALRELLSQHRAHALAGCLRDQAQQRAPVVGEDQGQVGAGQGDAAEHVVAVPQLGGLAAQELAARGRVEVELAHLHRGAG
jgi:hypothetical protein